MLLGDLRFEEAGLAAAEAYQKALSSWGDDEALLARRANVTYNLAALEAREGQEQAALAGFVLARKLALQAGNEGLAARIDEVVQRLESGE